MTELSERGLREVVTGDLSGVLQTRFREEGGGARVIFDWYVRVTNPLLDFLGYVAEGTYRHSRDSVMESGERSLAAYCRSAANGER